MTAQVSLQKKQSETPNKLIDTILNQTLGREATQIIYYYLENRHLIQKHEIVEKLDSFNRALEEYIGSGAEVIEKLILENLETRRLEENDDDFIERQKILKLF